MRATADGVYRLNMTLMALSRPFLAMVNPSIIWAWSRPAKRCVISGLTSTCVQIGAACEGTGAIELVTQPASCTYYEAVPVVTALTATALCCLSLTRPVAMRSTAIG